MSRRLRTALGAGLGAVALAGSIVATPSAALAQDQKLTDSAQWALDLMQVPAAQETTKGDGVTVAVIDTGMGEHPFFDDKDVLPGFSAFDREDDAWEDTLDGHGMQVAAGVLHVAPEATILPVRFDNGAEVEIGGLGATTKPSFEWAADNGADVIVFASGQTGENERITEAVQYAIDKGVVVISAVGNIPENPPAFPGNLPGVVGVAGTDTDGSAWYGTSTGPENDIAAPAENMLHPLPMKEDKGWGTEPEVEYDEGIAGTSVASGFVGGVAALTMAAHPDLDENNVIQRLIQTAGDGSGENRTDAMGFGLVNAQRAVDADGIETVDENPLGYPMGEAGASGASPDDDGEEDSEAGEGEAPAENSAEEPSAVDTEAASEESDSGLSTVIVIAAALVLIGAAVGVWLVLRGRSRKQAAMVRGRFDPGVGPAQGGYSPSEPPQAQHYAPPTSGPPQGYGSPPPPDPQGYSPPPGGADQSPPWQPSDPNYRR
ncbi:S8 family serine peptidase [Glycomyces xiaoerkulensis]|uniref:S8 family serine peptidase n=1 Tax=Glycomyces xiaoerkulensis TaxID=2038139 RepID=UPI0018E4BBC3|nr:S8 family serine peptidase [Glycomyces xiaoerkulensis]